jgi:hypothetical protein
MGEHPHQGANAVKDVRTKIAIAAVIFGLGGLGGYAIASNPAQQGAPAAVIAAHTTSGGVPQVSTGTSGAVNTPLINPVTGQPMPRSALIAGGGDD